MQNHSCCQEAGQLISSSVCKALIHLLFLPFLGHDALYLNSSHSVQKVNHILMRFMHENHFSTCTEAPQHVEDTP